ncbi:MAG: helix-turn-helix domain-containing protein [Chloroflexota bacterium]
MGEYKGVSADNTNLLKGDEVADNFKMRYEDVIRMATAGDIPSIKIGRRRRFPESWLAIWIDNQLHAQGWRPATS